MAYEAYEMKRFLMFLNYTRMYTEIRKNIFEKGRRRNNNSFYQFLNNSVNTKITW